MIVRVLVAGMSDKYSVPDVASRKKLAALGIKGPQIARLKKRLYQTLSGKNSPPYQQFAKSLDIRPSSTIKQVVERIPDLYRPVERKRKRAAPKPKDLIQAAVRTAVARASVKYSINEVTAQKTLRDLGVGRDDIVGIRTDIYKPFQGYGGKQPDLAVFRGITPSSTVKDIVRSSSHIFLPGVTMDFSLPGKQGRKRKGGFSGFGTGLTGRTAFGLAGKEGKGRKGGFVSKETKGRKGFGW